LLYNLENAPQNTEKSVLFSKQGDEDMKKRSECLNEYGSDYMIQKKIDAGELFKVGKAIYSKEKNIPEVAVLAYQYPNAVVTMRNAFYIYGLTDVVPDDYDLATDRNAAKIKNERVKQYFYPSDFYKQGITQAEYKGYPILIYNRERMLIELLRYKSKLPYDYYKEILLNYRKIILQLDIQKIQDYAMESPKSGKILEMLQTEVI